MNARRTAWLALALCLALTLTMPLVGCGKKEAAWTARPSTSTAAYGSSTPFSKVKEQTPPSGRIKYFELVVQSSLPTARRVEIDAWGSGRMLHDKEITLVAGSYKPIVTSSDLTTATVVEETQDSALGSLALEDIKLNFSPAASKALAAVTKSRVGDVLLVVIRNKVLGAYKIDAPVENGQITLTTRSAATDQIRDSISPFTSPIQSVGTNSK
jgi:hypothetical protein